MDFLLLVARIVFGAMFAVSAMGHLTQSAGMAGYAESRGVPNARIMVLFSGVVLAIGALSLVLGIWPDLGALALICFLVPTAFLMHGFWKESDAQAKQMEQIQFMKDMSLAGGALAFFVIFAYFGPAIDWIITDPAFSFDIN